MTSGTEKQTTLRSVGAVFAGLLVIVLASFAVDTVMHETGVFPQPGQPMPTLSWLWATTYRIVISIFGCYLAARLALSQAMKHALMLGWIGVAISALGTVLTWNKGPGFGPKWYPIALVAVALPCAWVGGKLATGRANRQAAGQAA